MFRISIKINSYSSLAELALLSKGNLRIVGTKKNRLGSDLSCHNQKGMKIVWPLKIISTNYFVFSSVWFTI